MSNLDAEGRVVTNKKSELDETIEWARDLAYGDIFDDIGWYKAQRYENIANWLEDYKDYINANFDLTKVADNRYKEGYMQAIDDFVTKAYQRLGCSEKELYCSDVIDEIAEQLKAGGVE